MIRHPQTIAAAIFLSVSLPAQLERCTSVSIGTKCGVALKVEDKIKNGPPLLHGFKIEVKNGPKDTFGFLAFGLTQTSYVFPGSVCNVYVSDIIRPFLFLTDKKGKWKVEFTENRKLNFTAFLQAALVDGSKVVTTNGIKLTCSDG